MSSLNQDNTDIDRLHAAVKREKQELPSGQESAPMWVILIGFAVAIFAAGTSAPFSNGFSFDASNAYANLPIIDPRPIKEGEGPQLDPFELALKRGRTVYNTCAGCHTPTGIGQPGLYPPLAGSEFVLGGTERIVKIVLNGLIGPITVKGLTYNSPPPAMPPHGTLMSDQEIADVITYVRNNFGNSGSMVTKAMVAEVRAKDKARTSQWINSELLPFAELNCPGEVPAGPGYKGAPLNKK
jgi:mono/diheme cytochrome c family protein